MKSSEMIDDVYSALRGEAARYAAQGRSLEPTELVHEVFLRLKGQSWENPRHFRAVASMAMRQLIVDHARRKNAVKRGGGQIQVTLTGLGEERSDIAILDLERALADLERLDGRMARVAIMRLFGGLELQEIADEEETSLRTIKRIWRRSRAWLGARLSA